MLMSNFEAKLNKSVSYQRIKLSTVDQINRDQSRIKVVGSISINKTPIINHRGTCP